MNSPLTVGYTRAMTLKLHLSDRFGLAQQSLSSDSGLLSISPNWGIFNCLDC